MVTSSSRRPRRNDVFKSLRPALIKDFRGKDQQALLLFVKRSRTGRPWIDFLCRVGEFGHAQYSTRKTRYGDQYETPIQRPIVPTGSEFRDWLNAIYAICVEELRGKPELNSPTDQAFRDILILLAPLPFLSAQEEADWVQKVAVALLPMLRARIVGAINGREDAWNDEDISQMSSLLAGIVGEWKSNRLAPPIKKATPPSPNVVAARERHHVFYAKAQLCVAASIRWEEAEAVYAQMIARQPTIVQLVLPQGVQGIDPRKAA